MTTASVNDPCECGQTTIRECADMPSRHCGAREESTPAFTAHELSALAEQGMTLTEAEETTVREARGQTAEPVTDIDNLIAEMRAGLEGVTPGPWAYVPDHFSDGSIKRRSVCVDRSKYDWIDLISDLNNAPDAAHIARCTPANVAALLDEIERLRADNAALTAERDQARGRWGELSHASGCAIWDQRKCIVELAGALREATALLVRYRKETPLGNQPHMIAHVADDFIARNSKAMEASNGNQ